MGASRTKVDGGGADHLGDRGGGVLLHLRDAADGDVVDPKPLQHRHTPMPPRQGVRRRSTTIPRSLGAEGIAPHKKGSEITPRKNGGEEHLSDGEPDPLRQALRLRRAAPGSWTGDEADADPAPLRQPLRRGWEIALRKNGSDGYLTGVDPAPLRLRWEIVPRKNGGEDQLSDGEPAPLRQALRPRRAWELDPCKNGHEADADPAPLRQPLRRGWEIAPRNGYLTDVDPAPLRRRWEIVPLKNSGDHRFADMDDPDPVPPLEPRRKRRACPDLVTMLREQMRRELGPLGPVKQEKSWKDCMGFPMAQTVEDTCSLVACTVCVEAMHRLVYEARHGPGTFPCRAAAPRKLRRCCRRDNVWTDEGAYICDVLAKIREIGGVLTTKAAAPAPWVLPLRDWDKHGGEFGLLSRLTMQRVAQLLDRGPCVGSVCVHPWFWLCDASSLDTNIVYTSSMSKDFVDLCEMIYGDGGDAISTHAIVCYAYRICGDPKAAKVVDKETDPEVPKILDETDEMHVLVMDNQDTTGPSRWVHYLELLDMYPLVVERLEPPLHLGGRRITYPRSGCYRCS